MSYDIRVDSEHIHKVPYEAAGVVPNQCHDHLLLLLTQVGIHDKIFFGLVISDEIFSSASVGSVLCSLLLYLPPSP